MAESDVATDLAVPAASSGPAPAEAAPADLAPYDAIIVQSFGGPEGPDEVLPFLRRVTAGRGIPDERLVEVGAHYELFDGVSPINALNRALVTDLQAALAARQLSIPVALGNRHTPPFVGDTLRELVEGGARRVVVVPTSAWRSWSSCRQYREDLAGAYAELPDDLHGEVVIEKVRPFGEHPTVGSTWADLMIEVLRPIVGEGRRPRLLFVTHSIPESMDETSGPGDSEGHAYSRAQAALGAALVAEVGEALGVDLEGELTFCSRSGSPHVPWLEPDIDDRLEELAAEGESDVVLIPIGFLSDHMEVVFDLDTQAADTAQRLGMRFARVPTPQPRADFVAGLLDLILERAAEARGESGGPATWRGLTAAPSVCAAGCCPNLQEARPALCGSD